MIGNRVDGRPEDGHGPDHLLIRLKPGEYGKDVDGVWYCCPPWKHGAGCLAKHTVVEHEDGTITVSPSILISTGDENGPVSWHGYLERGVWREC